MKEQEVLSLKKYIIESCLAELNINSELDLNFLNNPNLTDNAIKDHLSIIVKNNINDIIGVYSSTVKLKETLSGNIFKLINDDLKIYIIEKLIEEEKRHYGNKFKVFISILVDLSPNNNKFNLFLLKRYQNHIDANYLKILCSKIPASLQNQKIEILNKCKLFQVLKLRKTININENDRKRLIALFAKSPSLVDKINFNLIITLEDLKLMPISARYEFLQFYYRYNIDSEKYGFKQRVDYSNYCCKIEIMKIEDLKHLLFPLLIKKHAEVSAWIENYEKFNYGGGKETNII